MQLPRHFSPRVGAAAAPFVAGGVRHPLDVFVLEGRHRHAAEWIVGLNDAGQLTVQPTAPRDAIAPDAQAQLSFHEVAGGQVRGLMLETLFLFEIHLIEQPHDAAGTNDPIVLDGALVGPLGSSEAQRVTGQLTVTRADILHAALAGAPAAFLHAARGDGQTARSFHLMLPADRPDVIEAGDGVVLAYPVLGDVQDEAPGNEVLLNQALFDVLAGLWGDVARERPRRGWWKRDDEPRAIPRQASTDEYLRLAREGLGQLSGWPPAHVQGLWRRVQRVARTPDPSLARVAPTRPPVPVAAPPRSVAQKPERPAWMSDFASTANQDVARSSDDTNEAPRVPDWMKDFKR